MQVRLDRIERQFNSQKVSLLRNLEQIERKKRARFLHVSKELEKFKKKETTLKQIEGATSSHLKQINKKIDFMKTQDQEDKRKVREMVNEIRKLKKEIPKLESDMRRISPQKARTAKQEKNFSRKLLNISRRVNLIERKRDSMQRDMDALLSKENMLRQGKIYWTAQPPATRVKIARKIRATLNANSKPRLKAKSRARPAKAVRVQAREKGGFFNSIFKKN